MDERSSIFYLPKNNRMVPISKIAVANNSVIIKAIIIKVINHVGKLKCPNLCGCLN